MTDSLFADESAHPGPSVHNGTYTVEHPANGHFTLKLYTVRRGELEGRRILAMLVGPDNQNNYRGVAYWLDTLPLVTVWKRFRGPDSRLRIDGYQWQGGDNGLGLSTIEKKLCIWADLAIRGATEERHGYWFEAGYRLHLAGHCVVCNRKLTHPDSIKSGIGPTCAGRT